jgi:class 3 adenylate cyclase
MAQENLHLAILFADISGSTSLYESLGDQAAHELVSNCLSVLSGVTAQHQGSIVKTIGDEVMCTFSSAKVAIDAAIAMHKAFDSMPPIHPPDHGPPNIRVGLHAGPVIQKGTDVFGDAVNVAAQMVKLAKPRQIITTEQTVHELPSETGIMVKFADRTTLKGKGGEFDIYEVVWEFQNLTIRVTKDMASQILQSRLRLQLGDKVIEVNSNRPSITIGRHDQNDLVIDSAIASRLHACIEYRRGRFVLVDKSTNGTYLCAEGEEPIHLRGDEATLNGTGIICLGLEMDIDSPEAIHYTCED